jgi:hypothetical protein
MENIDFTFYKQTKDDWYGTYYLTESRGQELESKLVKISVSKYPRSNIYYIYLCGNDDFAIRKEFQTIEMLYIDLNLLLNQEYVNHEWLYQHGYFDDC